MHSAVVLVLALLPAILPLLMSDGQQVTCGNHKSGTKKKLDAQGAMEIAVRAL